MRSSHVATISIIISVDKTAYTNTPVYFISDLAIMTAIKTIKLLSGLEVPSIAFGTGTALYQQDCADAVSLAVTSGFNHLDAAQVYANEEYVGRAIKDSGVSRDRLFVTTKLGALEKNQTVQDALQTSLKKLGLTYVDLYLIHMPLQHAQRQGGVQQVWKEMVGVQKQGLAKSVGVSNFNKKQLEDVIATGFGVPEVNQVRV
jgi:diketogulonate reductase-like aldo/keto reductase